MLKSHEPGTLPLRFRGSSSEAYLGGIIGPSALHHLCQKMQDSQVTPSWRPLRLCFWGFTMEPAEG